MLIKNLFFFFIILFFYSCNNASKNELVLEKEDLQIIRFLRLDKQLNAFPVQIDSLYLDSMRNVYGVFFDIYTQYILNFGSPKDPALPLYLHNFSKDQLVQSLSKDVSTTFSNTQEIESKLTQAFSKYNILFEEKKPIPEIIFYTTGFNYHFGNISPKKIAVTETQLGIGLDMYLGSEYKTYQEYGFPKYFRETMASEYLVTDALKGWLLTEFDTLMTKTGKTLIEELLDRGKILYILDQLTENENKHLLFGFTELKYQWCLEHEKQMWTQLVNKNLLFTKKVSDIEPFFMEGPFTKDFPKESPAKALEYIGYRIIKTYCESGQCNKALDLLHTNNTVLFNSSKYKPQ